MVDTNTKVYGTDNIFVVDASIFPGIPSTNPSVLIVTAAEHASEKILALPDSTTSKPSTTSSACTVAASVAVTFDEIVTTVVGQTIKIAGSIPELGNWNTASAPSLSASQYTNSDHIWQFTVSLAAGKTFQYKFINVGNSGTVTWESDPNRSFTVPSSCEAAVTLSDSWR